ncbi:TetR/AcrR family transcriptional regulator [Kribbella antibiotica]|uniref:TetR/AcrR family transcriptional regulator n=1 Tax=Kribbella antibiotica TaxID=190195 RepID=A0A4R4ZSA1_9ACTN|nr:TetR/AcrR family transcriptional regulator [Kribbella antibiotica]TDD61911.1 TetR/AcrR family transcriptional regulator [Kribbella antibiotica]
MTPRATPLPPDERRAAIIAAALPLFEQHGPDVSTKQIAEAAGIAEGTIFRAFGSKDALIEAALLKAFDTSDLLTELTAVDVTLPLRERMVAAVEVGQRRLRGVFRLMFAMRLARPPDLKSTPLDEARRKRQSDLVNMAFTELLRPDSAQLRFSPEEVVRRLQMVTFSATHPMISGGQVLTAEEIVDFALDGVRRNATGQVPVTEEIAEFVLGGRKPQHSGDD